MTGILMYISPDSVCNQGADKEPEGANKARHVKCHQGGAIPQWHKELWNRVQR